MSYCGEVNEDDWCSFHACMRNQCRWQHEETFEQLQKRVAKTARDSVSERQAEQMLTGQDL